MTNLSNTQRKETSSNSKILTSPNVLDRESEKAMAPQCWRGLGEGHSHTVSLGVGIRAPFCKTIW